MTDKEREEKKTFLQRCKPAQLREADEDRAGLKQVQVFSDQVWPEAFLEGLEREFVSLLYHIGLKTNPLVLFIDVCNSVLVQCYFV